MDEFKEVPISDILTRVRKPVALKDDKEYQLLTIKMHHGGVVPRTKKFGSDIGSKMYEVRQGQFILSGIDARNGAFGIIPSELDKAIITNDFWCFDIDETVIKRDFFYWLTNSPLFLDACIKSSEGTTNRRRLQKDKFYSFSLSIPPIDFQEVFLQKLMKLEGDHSILNQEHDHQLSLLKKLRQAVLQEAVEGKLTADWRAENPQLVTGENSAERLLETIQEEKEKLVAQGKIKKQKPLPPITDDQKPFDLPDTWLWVRFSEICEIKTNIVSPHDFGDYPHVAPDNIEKFTGKLLDVRTVKEDGIGSPNHLFYPKTLIYSKVRPRLRKVAIVDFQGLCSADMYPLSPYINIYYLKWLMLSDFFDLEVYRFDNRVKMPKINQTQLNLIPVPLPPISEQKVIVERVERILAMVDELERQVGERKEYSRQLMQSVLKEAFNHRT
jgi:restriction endonuclease S subunit